MMINTFPTLCCNMRNQNLTTLSFLILSRRGVAWLITVGPGFDDWVYWYFFTIITAHTLNSFWMTSVWRMNLFPCITAREPHRDHRLQGSHSALRERVASETVCSFRSNGLVFYVFTNFSVRIHGNRVLKLVGFQESISPCQSVCPFVS
jgi:hypothetical protein